MQSSTNLNCIVRGYVHSGIGAERKGFLYDLRFNFASDDKAAEGITHALESFMNKTIADATGDTFQEFSFSASAERK